MLLKLWLEIRPPKPHLRDKGKKSTPNSQVKANDNQQKSYPYVPQTWSIPITTVGTLYYTVVHIHVYMQNITDICKNKNKKQLKCIAKNHINMITFSIFKIKLSTAGRTVTQRSFPYLAQSLESFVRISFLYFIWETVPDTGSLIAKRFKSIPGSINSWDPLASIS